MQKFGHLLLLLLLVTGLYCLTGCGGAAGTLGSVNQPGTSADGVTKGGFEAIRYNDQGYADSSLNGTLDLTVAQDGATTTVTISVADNAPMIGAAVDLYYDPAQFSPVNSAFKGLVDTPFELASSQTAGTVNLGQADTDGAELRSGQFAVVTFANTALRFASAAGDAHQVPVNRVYAPPQIAPASLSGFEVTDADADAGDDANYEIHSTFAVGDGNNDGATTIGDLTAMVANGYFGSANAITPTDFGTAPTDFDGNGETNVADLTAMAPRLNEQTTGIDVFIADDGTTFDGTQTVLTSHTWASGTMPVRPPADNTTDLAALFVQWDGTVTQAQIQAADTDADGNVELSARTTGTGAPGPVFTPGLAVGTIILPQNVTVTGATVTITEGDATQNNYTGNGDVAVTANDQNVVLTVTAISGMYNGVTPFDGGPAGAMTQAEYDAALAAVAPTATWAISTTADETNNKFYTSQPILNLSAATGATVNATVTPDADNPDSTTATSTEGLLEVDIAANGAFIPGPLSFDIRVDVEDDPTAPMFTIVTSSAPPSGGNLGLDPAGGTTVTADFTLGTAPLPADLNDVDLRLVDLSTTGASDIVLDYTANPAPTAGQFTIDTTGPNPKLIAVVPATAVPNAIYGIHLSYDNGAGGTTTSSVNYPNGTAYFSLGQAPVAQTFLTTPAGDDIGPNHDVLLIFYADPKIRRDPRAQFVGSTINFTDPAGQADIVKASGDEFILNAVAGGGPGAVPFPEVIVIQGTDPTPITSTTTSEPGVFVVYRTQGCIAVDISALTFGAPANPIDYAYKVFGGAANQANWPTYGQGTFTFDPFGLASTHTGINWGVNIFDGAGRGDRDLAGRVYTDTTLDAGTIAGPAQAGSAAQDVLWFEIGNFGYYDFDQADPFDYDATLSGKNTHLRFVDRTTAATMDVGLQPRTGALSPTGEILATFEPGQLDGAGNAMWFANPGAPGWAGILQPGREFDLILQDPANPAADFTYPTFLTVVGTNPN